jgi:hypothetical protein
MSEDDESTSESGAAVTAKPPGTLRSCSHGHTYRKSSDCPTCPTCEAARKPESGFLAELSAPARRALERAGITQVAHLSAWSKREILALHGVGPSTIPKLERMLSEAGLSFKG